MFMFPIAMGLVLILNALMNKRGRLLNVSLFVIGLVTLDFFATFTPLFVTELHEPLKLNPKTELVLKELKLEGIQFKRHRFSTMSSVIVNEDLIILPANYPSFNEAQLNYIVLRYIEQTLVDKEDAAAAEEAKKEGKKYLFAQKLKRLNTLEKTEIKEIIAKGGKEYCHINFSEIALDCKFVSKQEMNLSLDIYYSKEEFLTNLETQFSEVVKHSAKDKVVYVKPSHSTLRLPDDIFP